MAASECSFVGDSKEVKRVMRALGGRGGSADNNGRGSEVAHEGLISFTFFKD